MRKRKTRRGPTSVRINVPPLATKPPKHQSEEEKKTASIERRRREFQNLYDSLVNSREQFSAWFEETALIEAGAETKTGEFLDCVADFKKDQQRYRQIIKQLPNVAEFSEEELDKRSGKANRLLNIAGEITLMKTYFPRKIDRLRFLLEHRTR